MGRLEKVVVLTVLFLVALILGIALNPDEETDPQGAAPQGPTELAEPGPAAALAEREQAGPAGPIPAEPLRAQGLLSAVVESDSRTHGDGAVVPGQDSLLPALDAGAPGADALRVSASGAAAGPSALESSAAARPFLLTTEGLEASRIDELRIYTWKAGDSFTALSDRYYGSRLETGRLRSANEGRDETALMAGDKIFVPARPAERDERLARAEGSAGQWIGGYYVVESGDILGRISQKVYGSAARWRRIYDANRDVLSSPDDLEVGMRLRIPE